MQASNWFVILLLPTYPPLLIVGLLGLFQGSGIDDSEYVRQWGCISG
jgi:hypothetical protein